MSFDFSKLKEIFNETERNLKLIEYQNSKFAVSVLNELRYALRHAIDSDEAKTMAHLQRALFDSYDLLLIYQFARASFQRNAGLFAIAREGCLSGLQRGS